MNPLSKFQLLMLAFLLLVLFSVVLNPFLVVLAAIVFVLQYAYARGELKKDHPEDWRKYLTVFIFYEVLVSVLIFAVSYTLRTGSFFDLTRIYTILGLIFFVLAATTVSMMILKRGHTFGTVIFIKDNWVGVSIRGDLFSKINEANYAVENPEKLKVKKGDRVRIKLKKMKFAKAYPKALEEVIR